MRFGFSHDQTVPPCIHQSARDHVEVFPMGSAGRLAGHPVGDVLVGLFGLA